MVNRFDKKNWAVRAGKTAVTAGLCVILGWMISQEYRQARLRKLNYMMPDEYAFLIDARDYSDPLSQARLEPYAVYFRLLTRIMPQLSEAHHLLGFCAYYQGHEKEALRAFDEAVKINPVSFWSWYDLGMINYLRRDWYLAAEYFQKALKTDPRHYGMVISRSKVFSDILRSLQDPRLASPEYLRDAYQNAYQMTVMAYLHNEEYEAMQTVSLTAIKNGVNRQGRFSFYAGLASMQLKDYKVARIFLESVLQEGQKSPEVFTALSEVYRELGEDELSLKAAQAVSWAGRDAPSFLSEPELTLHVF